MDDFCAARPGKIPALPWPNLQPPYTLNTAKIFPGHVVGVTEITLAVVMIIVLALRPGGFVPTREIGDALLERLKTRKGEP